MSFSDEIRGAVKAFRNETMSVSSIDRLTNALELIADRIHQAERPSNVIPIPQHKLRSLTVVDLPRLNGSES